MDMRFHFRALDEAGNTIRQSTTLYPTAETAQAAADKESRIHGEEHVVCVSIDPKDPRNDPKNPLKAGWIVYDPSEEESPGEDAPKATTKKKK